MPDADGFTVSQGINNAGQIVGLYDDADGVTHGFIWSKGVFMTIDVPDAVRTEVYSINANGEIAGVYDDEDGVHGFVGRPGH